MRERLFRSAVAGVVAAVACVACSLTTDLSGLSEGAGSLDAAVSPADDGGPVDGGSRSDAADAADPSALYAATVRADGPIAYWRCDDPFDANSAKDELGSHPAATTSAGAKFGMPGVRGGGVTFDGTGALDVGDAFDFAGQVPFTLEFWVRPSTSLVEGHLVNKRTEVSGELKGYILYGDNNGNPHFEVWGVTMNAYSNNPLPATFSHVVVTVSYETGKGNAKLYVNAAPSPIGGYDNTMDLADTPARLLFGNFFKGVLDEIALYDKVLSPERILEHYRAGR